MDSLLRVFVFGERFGERLLLDSLPRVFLCGKSYCWIHSLRSSSPVKGSCWIHCLGFPSSAKSSGWIHSLGFSSPVIKMYMKRKMQALHRKRLRKRTDQHKHIGKTARLSQSGDARSFANMHLQLRGLTKLFFNITTVHVDHHFADIIHCGSERARLVHCRNVCTAANPCKPSISKHLVFAPPSATKGRQRFQTPGHPLQAL